jgi:pimeloyl-ACP methyl ester carboxylesterase
VVAFDRLGQGFTDLPKEDAKYTMQASVQHSYDFLTSLGVRDATLIGHSRGAYVAARLAIENPALVKNLILVDSNTLPPDDPSTPKDFYTRIERELPEVPTRESVRREAEANSFSSKHITPDFVEELYAIAKLPKTRDAKTKMAKLRDSLFIPELNRQRKETVEMIRNGRLKKPVLIVWGLNDPSAPYILALDLFRLIAAVNVNTQLHIFNQAGHHSFREHPEQFNDLVVAFS